MANIAKEFLIVLKNLQQMHLKLTDAKLYVSVVTISTLDNVKLLQQLIPFFKRTINWNKYLSKVKAFTQNQY